MAQVTTLDLTGVMGPLRSFSAKAEAASVLAAPFCIQAAQVFQQGSVASHVFQQGKVASEVFQQGAVAKQGGC